MTPQNPEFSAPILPFPNPPVHSGQIGLTVALPPKLNPAEVTRRDLIRFLMTPPATLADGILSYAMDGGVSKWNAETSFADKLNAKNTIQVFPQFQETLHSGVSAGFDYFIEGKLVAKMRLALLQGGRFAFIREEMRPEGDRIQTLTFGSDGKYRDPNANPDIAPLDAISVEALKFNAKMEPSCPVLNLLYLSLAEEYPKTKLGSANSDRIHTIERILHSVKRHYPTELSFLKAFRDPALKFVHDTVLEMESDPVLSWKERREKFKTVWAERKKVIQTKSRAHRALYPAYGIQVIPQDLVTLAHRFKARPFSNSFGTLKRFTLDPVKWFFSVVRNNMGYSIAMGLYSPFTFFFITQPMNPHAMWAVGKVRSAYIDFTDRAKALFVGSAGTAGVALSYTSGESTNAAPGSVNSGNSGASQNNTTGPAAGTTSTSAPSAAGTDVSAVSPQKEPTLVEKFANAVRGASGLPEDSFGRAHRSANGIPLSTDSPVVDRQSWDERMSHFKDMQIAFEGNLEIAPRFGRLEQMETQLNWPLIIESTWEELERYQDQLVKAETKVSSDSALTEYVRKEKERLHILELYLWDRNVRFILDHPYTMMDDSKEQEKIDYYVGRAFVELERMTQTLVARAKASNGTFKLPAQYAKIAGLAQKYESSYVGGPDLFARLKNNSVVYKQADRFSAKELRRNMRRQWEVLYLLQNKAQEGANMGLQVYMWSIRNAVWIMQSIYSAKRQELTLLVEGSTNKGAYQKIDSQLEALLQMLTLEFTSIKTEIGEALKNDIETTQRQSVIETIESSLGDHAKLMKAKGLI